MFRIDADPKFWSNVTVKLEGEEDQTFKARFKVLAYSKTDETNLSKSADVAKLLTEAFCDIADVEDEKGAKLEFTLDLRDRLIDMPHIRGALLVAYVNGISGARMGN